MKYYEKCNPILADLELGLQCFTRNEYFKKPSKHDLDNFMYNVIKTKLRLVGASLVQE